MEGKNKNARDVENTSQPVGPVPFTKFKFEARRVSLFSSCFFTSNILTWEFDFKHILFGYTICQKKKKNFKFCPISS